MAFGRSGGGESAVRAEQSRRLLEAGGLPLAARERLSSFRAGRDPATSDLSTAEFLLLREAGFRPLVQVMGSCFYRVGYQYMPGMRAPMSYRPEGRASTVGAPGMEFDSLGRRVYTNAWFGQVFELDTETQAWQEARRLALHRLAEEARLVGAAAVVGVSLRRGSYSWGGNELEFVAVGTAVASDRYDLGPEPVLSNLSGQDFAKLLASGYWPCGLVVGSTVVLVLTGWEQRRASRPFGPNRELADFTQGIVHARKVALGYATREARSLGAAGIVGVSLEVEPRRHRREGVTGVVRQRDMVVTAHALGTAIVELAERRDPPPVRLALALEEAV